MRSPIPPIILEIFSIVPMLTMLEVVTKKSNYGIIIRWNVVKASILWELEACMVHNKNQEIISKFVEYTHSSIPNNEQWEHTCRIAWNSALRNLINLADVTKLCADLGTSKEHLSEALADEGKL